MSRPMPRKKGVSLSVPTPLGYARLTGDGAALTQLVLEDVPGSMETGGAPPDGLLARARLELLEYFEGRRADFSVPLSPTGTDFQRRVWEELVRIPYGETRSYRQIAEALGCQTASRAVGAAIGRNRLWILIPCHRVIGSHGELTGYAGGLDRKRWLLDHEHSHPAAFPERAAR